MVQVWLFGLVSAESPHIGSVVIWHRVACRNSILQVRDPLVLHLHLYNQTISDHGLGIDGFHRCLCYHILHRIPERVSSS